METTNRAASFKKTRHNRLLEVAEDYTELIAEYKDSQKNVRVCDIAKDMGISHVSVLNTLKRLIRDGYLVQNANKCIDLTEKGKEMAAFSKKKHLILTQFLLSLGIPEEIVAADVEGIEHHISSTTLNAIAKHMNS